MEHTHIHTYTQELGWRRRRRRPCSLTPKNISTPIQRERICTVISYIYITMTHTHIHAGAGLAQAKKKAVLTDADEYIYIDTVRENIYSTIMYIHKNDTYTYAHIHAGAELAKTRKKAVLTDAKEYIHIRYRERDHILYCNIHT